MLSMRRLSEVRIVKAPLHIRVSVWRIISLIRESRQILKVRLRRRVYHLLSQSWKLFRAHTFYELVVVYHAVSVFVQLPHDDINFFL